MSKWMELGEVPDSEDEDGFDSQDSLPNADPPINEPRFSEHGTAAEKGTKKDIWDIPDSSDHGDPPTPIAKQARQPITAPPPTIPCGFDSSPLSLPASDIDIELSPVLSLSLAQNDDDASTNEPPPSPTKFDATTSNVDALSPVREPSDGGDETVPQRPTGSRILSHDAEGRAVGRAAFRYGRSLRPRKPIQEHPYLLENAQYSSFLKQHGVKPVRMAIEAERRRREQAQDKDFDDGSQGSGLLGKSDESQLNSLQDFLEGLDNLEFPSPSPPQTSPLNDRAGPSSQVSSTGDTDNTSLVGEDLPSLQDLFTQPPRSTLAKRQDSPPRSSTRKRRRQDVVDNDPFEPATATFKLVPELLDYAAAQRDLRRSPGSGHAIMPIESQLRRSLFPSQEDAATQPMTIDSDSEDEIAQQQGRPVASDEDGASDSASESGSEVVHSVRRRIKGVLPASWLRLDQQSGLDRIRGGAVKRQAARSPKREHRRGVAQVRQSTPRPTMARPFIFDDSEDDLAPSPSLTTDDKYHNQTCILLKEGSSAPIIDGSASDGGASVIEDDHIDRMLPGRKRQLKLSESFSSQPKRTKTSRHEAKRMPIKTPRQPRITSLLNGSDSTVINRSTKKYRSSTLSSKPKGVKTHRSQKGIKPIAAHLSLLDVVEPNAPRFLKIAARAMARRRDQGRSNPAKKLIRLATREDHVDAVSVLDSWRAGSIPQRQSVSAAQQSRQFQRRPKGALGEISGNQTGQPPSAPPASATRKLVKHASYGGSVTYQVETSSKLSPATRRPRSNLGFIRTNSAAARPAQLEMDEMDQARSVSFQATKRRLDHLYRRQRGAFSISSILDLGGIDAETHFSGSPPPEEDPLLVRTVEEDQNPHRRKSRLRKNARPQQVDIEAPQYRHANDPILIEPPSNQESRHVDAEGKRLMGLGPYGTQYTHHFEIFPLDSRVYFHESTLIGSGAVVNASEADMCKCLLGTRPRVSFTLDDQTLRWGTWNAQVSSELGILLDFVVEQLGNITTDDNSDLPLRAMSGTNFILKYVQDSLSFRVQTDAKSFVSRALEALRSFNERINSFLAITESGSHKHLLYIARIYDRLLLTALLIYRICQSDIGLMGEQFLVEELLRDLAKTCVVSLLGVGLDLVRITYQDLRSPQFREQGLRDGSTTLHSWVILMKVLDHAKIPRGSFWDVTYTVMATSHALDSLNARDHEQLWSNMFSLLPLSEFDDTGIVLPGSRHDTTSDGWSLPQKLLKNVFQLYKENAHQSPSFNNYCRALVGRCHYLVQQWGWRKCATIVGVIFDFFGSQHLAHLRNEEVYKSPQFLEELARSPSLDIEPADRCFHVFLKLIALSIKKLREVGSINDIRNLVARTMPNHDRLYLKEQNIHERDLAALRNHHDLLCTLFWASPPEQRPAVRNIERLVLPESSHKEACLINLRAWSQLSRFVVSSGEVTTSFKPFAQWRNNFFQQLMQQFDSVEADIQQQFLALSKDISNTISTDMVTKMVKTNKAAVMDILHYSISASLDVMKHAPDLEAAAFVINSRQLHQVFKHFTVSPPEFDWGVLRAALATLATFLSTVDDFRDNEGSQQSESQILNSALADDAILVIDNEIASSYFSMARCILSTRSNKNLSTIEALDKASSTEEVVTLSARLGLHFMHGGLLRLSDMFKFGKYGLFEDVPAKLNSHQRKYLVLFVYMLLKNGYNDFNDAGFTVCELWLLSIIKPQQHLLWENRLAEQLRKHRHSFVPEAAATLAVNPNYTTNRDMFEFTISHLRKSVRDAGQMLKKMLISEHSKTLKAVMQHMKNDLKELAQDPSKHAPFVSFVREIVTLIRAHGSEFCSIDEFYYQISKEYSPSLQDPQLQLAGMLSYGLRLSEGDTKVAQSMFFLLINNFKTSLNSDRLDEEVKLLRRGMKTKEIFSFIMGKMLPAIIRATFLESAAYPLMDVYGEALQLLLGKSVVPHEMTQDDLPCLHEICKSLIGGMHHMRQRTYTLQHEQMHFLRQVVAMMNHLWPCIRILSLSPPSSADWAMTQSLLGDIAGATAGAESYLGGILETGGDSIRPDLLLAGLRRGLDDSERVDSHVRNLTANIIDDVRKNWVFTTDRVSTQAPSKGRNMASTQSHQGAERPVWDARELAEALLEEMHACNEWWQRAFGASSRKNLCTSVLF